ncbi:MAG TPA: hypothetical protein VMU93_14080 [Caulobacteraceae bacterium]|nr:hypothetical protein [Caulobacteraceae bacterium]
MSDDNRRETFWTPEPPRLRVEIPKGRIRLSASGPGETRIELVALDGDARSRTMIAGAEIAQNGAEILVRVRSDGRSRFFGLGGSIEALIQAPAGADAVLSTGAGKIETRGRLGKLDVRSGAGAISVDDCAEAHARSGAGAIAIGSASGSVDAKSGSGGVKVGKVGADAALATGAGSTELAEVAGAARLATGVGDIDIGRAGDAVEAFCAAGSIRVRRADHGRVRAQTVAGAVSVGVASGVAALLDVSTLSGRVNSELGACDAPGEGEPRVELILSTVSGAVNLARVRP